MPTASVNGRRPWLALQFGKFAAVGLTNSALSVAVFDLLAWLGCPYALAAAPAFLAGAINGYVWNRRWTFAAADSSRARAAYLCVQVFGLGATSLLAAALGRIGGLGATAVYVLTVPPVTILMFLVNRTWTFTPGARGRSSLRSRARSARKPSQLRRGSGTDTYRFPG